MLMLPKHSARLPEIHPPLLLLSYLAQGLWQFALQFPLKFMYFPIYIRSHFLQICFCSFISRVFGHALEDSHSKSALIHSLSVGISILDPKRSIPSSLMYSFRSQHQYEPPLHADSDTIGAMLPNLGITFGLFKIFSLDSKFVNLYTELKLNGNTVLVVLMPVCVWG